MVAVSEFSQGAARVQFPGKLMASQSIAAGVVPRISVHICGRNRLLCEALVRLLRKRAGFCVQATHPGVSAQAESENPEPSDVLLADSLDACRVAQLNARAGQERSCGHLLLFGMDDNREQFLEAIRLGASGYLLNDASSEDIVQGIKMVVRGEAVCPPRLCMYLFQQVGMAPGRRTSANEDHDRTHGLTMRQRQLMDLVSKGLSNKEIATRLNLSQFTVKNHVRRILQHVDVETRHEAVDVMRASGILPLA